MRKYKNNITLRLKNTIFNIRNITLNYKILMLYFRNIILYLEILIGHLTERVKILILRSKNITLSSRIITFSLIILMLNLVNIINTSALSYRSNVGVGFTFNPTLSISLSSADLVIDNLVPGSTEDSNSINVSVATNAAYGYTLSATANSNDLIHSNNTNVFNSIATNADLTSLEENEDNNIWGYTSKLGNEIAWNNYNGLSSSSSTVLLDSNNKSGNVEGNNSNNDNNGSNNSIDFKISAKASSTQPSGVYTGTINFIAVSKVAPMSLLDSFIASGATMRHGYYAMQDMTHDICESVDIEESELQLIDIRDNKIYWVAKLKDGNCWMTQNLDLDLDSNRTYTHWDTDLGWSTDNGNTVDEDATWKPSSPTINFDGATTNQVAGWINSNTEPYSANPGDIYYYTSNTEADDIKYNSLQECIVAGHNDCSHYHAGDYYNWSAAVADNDTSEMIDNTSAPNSICPSNWRLPSSFVTLISFYETKSSNALKLRNSPLYFARSGCIYNRNIANLNSGIYWKNLSGPNISYAYNLGFNSNLYDGGYYGALERRVGISVRCLAR